jgi:hypothetical protein
MLRVYAQKLGTVAILCLQGRIVNGETGVNITASVAMPKKPAL